MPLDPHFNAAVTGDVVSALILLFALLIGHALGDFPLQGTFLATFKNPGVPTDGENLPPDIRGRVIWPYCLTAHALIHGGLVWLVLGSPLLAFVEFVLHWLIDLAKSVGITNFHADQALHILCKVVYVVVIFLGWI